MARFQCFRTDSTGVRWRLLGGNNRVLGVSVRGHVDQGAAVREVDAIREDAADGRLEFERSTSGHWWWQLSVSDVAIARSAQGFARKIDADLAAKRFMRRVTEASLDSSVMVFQPGHRGRLT
ncbi:hypothetical protein JOF56_001324 [Kibdelosporangium banguiense]|uniref:DUF1508 domain-containing protein n=1 Tax=Kibdelosporangium banguiense TaxID=1365924 RepID=A0ABS4T949_9PSEU|nr:hypothetical protein [Kibdelosporangium banguiense]MBP2320939.1 hypothetical protein [Kibdelosporangium banguiense]